MKEIKEALSKIREEWEYFEYPTGGVEIFEKESRAIIGMFYPTNSNGGFDGKVVAKYPEWLSSLVAKVEEMQKTLDWAARIIDSGMYKGILQYDPKEWFAEYWKLKGDPK